MSSRARSSAPRGRPDPLVGTVVAGRFRIEARIAAGGMGTVYRAEQLGLDRKVALKLLHATVLEDTEDSAGDDLAVIERRFSREAAILARLAHPNVVTVFDYGRVDDGDTDDRKFFMAMELLAGETLQERLSRNKLVPVAELLPIAQQIARGLREAHALGIVHRDLKPANVMLVRDRDGEEQVKLLDFGIGKVLDRDDRSSDSTPSGQLTQEGRFVGSPQYMSPEQIAHGRVDARADLYTLGVVMYRCIAGIHPFQRERTSMVLLAHLHEQATPLRERVPDCPAWLSDLVERCMAKDPDQRPPTADDVVMCI
jgi:serine/threonine protein kinase